MTSLAEAKKDGFLANGSRPIAESSLPSTQLSSFLTDPSRSAAPSNNTEDESEFDESDDAEQNGSVVRNSYLKSFTHGGSPIRPQTSPLESPSKSRTDLSFLSNSSRHSDTGKEDLHNSQDFQNLSFMNDTKAQFDLAIDLDDTKFTQNARKLLLWLHTNGDKSMSSIRKALVLSKSKLGTMVDSSSTQKHEDLVKQLTDCKIQLKLYDKFLQDLIDKKQIDVGDITDFHENWEERELTVAKLRHENDEMSTLVEDLYANLEESQQKWRQADQRADILHNSFEELKDEISKLLLASGIPDKLVQSHDTASYINLAIPLLRTLIDSDKSNQEVTDLEERIEVYEREARQSEKLLSQQTEEIASWKAKYNDLEIQIDQLQEAVDTTPQKFSKDVEARFAKYETMIDDLQRQIDQREDTSRQSSVTELPEHQNKMAQKADALRQYYDELSRQHEELEEELRSTKLNMNSKIKSLTTQLDNRKNEQLALRDQLALMDELKQNLEFAVEKQRKLQSEKMKLSYQVEELNQAKSKLQGNIDVLTEKLQDAHIDDEIRQEPNEDEESKLMFHQLYEFDIAQLSKLGETFDRLVDDSSINEPIEKIKTIEDFLRKSDAYILDYPEEVISDLLQCHKSLFHYFTKAADLSVDDHISLLLKKEQRARENDLYVERLSNRIVELEKQNDNLARQTEASLSVPEYDLRIQELTSRWKAEREARVYENKLAKRRFNELEEEIRRLREAMSDAA